MKTALQGGQEWDDVPDNAKHAMFRALSGVRRSSARGGIAAAVSEPKPSFRRSELSGIECEVFNVIEYTRAFMQ